MQTFRKKMKIAELLKKKMENLQLKAVTKTKI